MIDPRPKAVIAKLDGVTLRCLYAVQDALSVQRERKVTVSDAVRYCIENVPLPLPEPHESEMMRTESD